MKLLSLVMSLLFVGSYAIANPTYYNETLSLIESVKNNDLSFDDILLLEELNSVESNIGYNLCIASGVNHWECHAEGTLGYGLCIASGVNHWECDSSGTLGYGFCIVSGVNHWECNASGTLGYGLCVVSGVNHLECKNEEEEE